MKVSIGGSELFRVTTEYGIKDKLHPAGHHGIDLAMSTGEKIMSPSSGVVERIFDYGSANAGKGVVIETPNHEHLIFGHMSDNSLVRVGESIQRGDVVGLAGNTGRSTGSHLHFGVKDDQGQFINPQAYLNSGDGGNGTEIVQLAQSGNSFNTCDIHTSIESHNIFNQGMSKFMEGFSDMTFQFIDFIATFPIDIALLIKLLIPV